MKLTMDEIETWLDVLEEEKLNFSCSPERRKELENKQLELYQKFRELYNATEADVIDMRDDYAKKLEEMEKVINATQN